ncbi:MAG: hypothetical protein V2A58_17750 [Planctomycetota bacterium]
MVRDRVIEAEKERHKYKETGYKAGDEEKDKELARKRRRMSLGG